MYLNISMSYFSIFQCISMDFNVFQCIPMYSTILIIHLAMFEHIWMYLWFISMHLNAFLLYLNAFKCIHSIFQCIQMNFNVFIINFNVFTFPFVPSNFHTIELSVKYWYPICFPLWSPPHAIVILYFTVYSPHFNHFIPSFEQTECFSTLFWVLKG
jgi:hypothetical protein